MTARPGLRRVGLRRAGLRRAAALLSGSLLLGACSVGSPTPDGPLAGEQLVEALRDGGYVLYLRHTATARTGVDDPATLGDCSRQRPLSTAGRRDARELGFAVRALRVPVGDVVASPFCRTVDTAQLAFGRTRTDEGLLALAPDGRNRERTAERARLLLGAPPAEGRNTVLVGHVSNLGLVSTAEPEEGGTVVFRPDGDGGFRLVGEVPPQGWQALQRTANQGATGS